MNRFAGMIGTTLGGGLIGAGVQRTQMAGNKLSSGFSKLVGKGGLKFDETTWELFILGALLLIAGVYLSSRRK